MKNSTKPIPVNPHYDPQGLDPNRVSFFGHSYQYQVNCHDPNNTTIFTNDIKSERVTKTSRSHGATLIEFELF